MAEGKELGPEGPAPVAAAGGAAKDSKGGRATTPPTKPGTPPGKRDKVRRVSAQPDRQACTRAEVRVRCLLARCELQLLCWRPAQALAAALEALQFMGQRGADGRMNAPLGDNDDTQRYALGPELWLQARLQAVEALVHLRQLEACHLLIDASLQDAAQVSDNRVAAALLHIQAHIHEVAGNTAAAFNGYGDAHVLAAKTDVLHRSGHTLVPVTAAKLPDWAKEYVQGQEQAFALQHGIMKEACAVPAAGQGPPVPLKDAEVGRMVVCHFLALLRSAPTLPLRLRTHAQAHIIALHDALRTACPKYASDVCFPDVLQPTADKALPLAPGTVRVQWYPQDGCWQAPQSWQPNGRFTHAVATEAELAGVPAPVLYASMLYVVINANGESQAGELVFEVRAVQSLLHRVKQLRHRLEFPKAPTDLLGHDLPSSSELQSLRHAAEHFLGKRRGSEDGMSQPSAVELVTGTHPRPDSVPRAPSPSRQPPDASPVRPSKTDASATPAIVPPTEPSSTDLTFLKRLEAMLSLDSGIDSTDLGFALFLEQTLPAS
ncbi:uncharacterized protein HaLaN_13341 [Haematococcus lacustris]|uniref:Uncharacterized protein n=1 Tax=Haematococcus lacustris TaxID=44745 RepID=A0A699Z2Q2_HAELA|nr:uncharacterized protein HaLaN_13341 [Haematococcus lacustris]